MTFMDLMKRLKRDGFKRAHIREGQLGCEYGMVPWIEIHVRKLPSTYARINYAHDLFSAGTFVTWWKLPWWKNLWWKFTMENFGVEQFPPRHFNCRSGIELLEKEKANDTN